MIQITDHIYCMENDDMTDQPYIFFIHAQNKNIQIDVGNSPQNYKKFLNEVDNLGFELPKMIAITHWHWDHTFGICATNVPVLASWKTNEYLKKCKQWRWTAQAMIDRLKSGEDIEFCFRCMHRQYPDITKIKVETADVVFSSNFTIDLGDVHIQALLHDSPHTRDSVFYLVEEDGMLIGGDAEFEDYYDYDGKYDPERLISFISFLENLQFDWYLRSHDDVKVSKPEILNKLRQALTFK